MAVNRKIKREYNLADFQSQATEAMGGVPGVKLNLDDGESVIIPHPVLIDDATQAAVERVQSRQDLDVVDNDELRRTLVNELDEDTFAQVWPLVSPHIRITGTTIDGEPAEPFTTRLAKAILGEEEHAKLIAGGGSSNIVGLVWKDLSEAMSADPKLPR